MEYVQQGGQQGSQQDVNQNYFYLPPPTQEAVIFYDFSQIYASHFEERKGVGK